MPPLIEAQKFKHSDILLIGEDPLAVNENGELRQRIHTFFIDPKVYITTPGIHSMQRLVFIDYLNQERERSGQPKLKSCEERVIMDDSVAIVIQFDEETMEPFICVRNDGDEARANRARDVLCQAFPEYQVRVF